MSNPTPQHDENRELQALPHVRRAPGIRLQRAEIELLRAAFPGAATLFIEREFRSGYSGALVLMVSVDSGQAPVVVKLAHPLDLQREYSAYHEFVLQRSPQNTANLRGAPIVCADGTLALQIYTFAGGSTQQPSSSLEDYYRRNGGSATAAVLTRIFRVYGRHWWAINQPRKFVLAEEYDRLLPVHLLATVCEADRSVDAILEAGKVSAVDLRDLVAGTHLELRGFRVAGVENRGEHIKLSASPPAGEASASIRIRVVGSGIVAGGDEALSSVFVEVTATRMDLLQDAAGLAMPSFTPSLPTFDLPGSAASSVAVGQSLNPLLELDALMDRVVEARFSTIHGDLNLQNILVDQPTGFAWLIDFAETRVGPTLYDLQRLEVQIITKLLTLHTNGEPSAATALHTMLTALHADPPARSSPVASLQEPYALLNGLRRLVRQYLMDDLDWDEYYAGLIVAMIGALKFDELTEHARLLALSAAAILTGLLGHAPRTGAPRTNTARTRPVRDTVDAEAAAPVAALTIPAPPEPGRLPQLQGFVGRTDELSAYADALESRHLAVISGMAGVGKTALATELARWVARPGQIFWHTFHEGDGLATIVWKLAAFLAWHGYDDLWRLLESARLTGGRPPQSDTLFDYLIQLLRGRDFLLCFDDYHMVDDDPSVARLLERLLPILPGSGLRLLLTTRRSPTFAGLGSTQPLTGLSNADTHRLLAARGLSLSVAVVDQLHTQTGGNAQFLTLAIDILQQATDPDLLLDRLAAADDMERYLLSAVDEGLSGAERSVLQSVALFLGHPATRDAIEAVMNAGSVWRTLRLLHDRHLLISLEGAEGKEYAQHAIVRAFYYQGIGRRQRRGMHQRAGSYYATEDPDLLRSGIHYERAAAYELAVRQATADVWAIINRGQARLLRSLLERFGEDQLSADLWAAVNVARGTTTAFLDDRETANECFREALETLAELPSGDSVATLKAQAFHGVAELLEMENPAWAIDWVERAFAEAPAMDEASRGTLLIKRGTAEMYLGRYEDALRSLEQGLATLPESATQQRGIALMNLGGVHFFRGELATALQFQQEALAINRRLHDRFGMVNTLIGLGVNKICSGQWQEAIADFQSALSIAQELGSAQLEAEVSVNLGGAYVNTGDDAAASAQLARSLELANSGGLPVLEAFAAFRTADLEIRLGHWAAATLQLSRAEEIAEKLNQRGLLISIYRGWAEVRRAEGDLDAALAFVHKSTQLADELSETLEKGESLRTLGVVLRDTGERQQARAALEESLALLVDEDPYEAARTMAELGALLIELDEQASGTELLADAAHTFRRLGAQRDLDGA